MVKIVIVQEQSLLREGIINIFHSLIHNVTVSTYSSIEHDEIYEEDNLGDLLFLDIQNDVDILKVIKLYQNNDKKIIVWISNKNDEQLLRLFPEGLNGYFYTEMDTNEFVSGIQLVMEGKRYVHSTLIPILFDDYLRRVKDTVVRPNNLLTNREWEILELLTKGYNNEEVARYLDISIRTVKNHVSSMLKKLNVSNRTNAVSMALKKRWFN